MRDITNRFGSRRLGEVLRFGVVGVLATAIQYGVYWLALWAVRPALALTLGYAVSLCFNFVASTRYTFRIEASARRGAGFLFSHAVNYLMQVAVLHVVLWLGVAPRWAPLPMFAVCVPVNFLLVRYFLKR